MYVIEPHLGNVGRLRTNITLNSQHNITAIQAAASGYNGKAVLYTDPLLANARGDRNSGLAAITPVLPRMEYSGEAEVLTLDSVLANEHRRVELIKIDVEGSEPAVIRGADAILRMHRPAVVMELNEEALTGGGIVCKGSGRNDAGKRLFRVAY